MKKKCFLNHLQIVLFCLCSLSLFTQENQVIDSLKLQLKQSKADTVRAEILNDLAYYYLYQDIDRSLIYGNKALKKAKYLDYYLVQAKANLYLGNAFLFTNRYDSARYYYNISYKVFDDRGLNKSAIYSSLGMLHKNEGNYEKAVEIYYEGIKYDEETSNEYGKFVKLLNLSNVYYLIENFEKGLKIQLQTLDLVEKSNNPNLKYYVGTLLNNIGAGYSKLNQSDKALIFFNRSLKANLKNQNKKEIGRNYNNIASLYRTKNQFAKALQQAKKALLIREELGDKDELVETNMELGSIYGKMNDKQSSNYHFNKAIDYAESINNKLLLSDVYLAKSNSLVDQKNSKDALIDFKNYIRLRDSVRKEENFKKIEEIEIKYETAKKDNEIANQELLLKEQENQLLESERKVIWGVSAFIFLSIILLVSYFVNKQRQKLKDNEIIILKQKAKQTELEKLIEAEEKERTRIAQDLHDGVNGDLSAIKYHLSNINQEDLTQNLKEDLDKSIGMIDVSCDQIRSISHNLSPYAIENYGLIDAVEQFCTKLNETSTTEIVFQNHGKVIHLPKFVETTLYRIIQELVSNVIKHAKAKEALVQINYQDEFMLITVEDDGVGFDSNTMKDGIGLKNIKSRVDLLDAKMNIDSNNSGSNFEIEIDLNNYV